MLSMICTPLAYGSMPCNPTLRNIMALVCTYKKLQYSFAVRLQARSGFSMGCVLPVLCQ